MSSRNPKRFSVGWCIIVTTVHFLVSITLPYLAFGIGMSGFSNQHGDINAQIKTIELFSWIWTTIPMLLLKVMGVSYENGLFFYMFAYSLLIGVMAGYVVRRVFPR